MSDTIADRERPSGRFLLRISPGLHETLRRGAEEAGLSLNEFCARTLAGSGELRPGPGGSVVRQATALFGDALVGVLVFGSWARGEAADTSDIDLLVVVDETVAVVRDLYRRWDAAVGSQAWDGRRVEVHFVHLPSPGVEVPGSLWVEAALDGVVLYERGFDLSRRLGALRRAIARGEVRLRHAAGHAYWVEGEE